MQSLASSPNIFFCHKTILAGLKKKVKTTHHMGAKLPTSEMTHGRNDQVPGVSIDRLIFRRLVIPSKGSYCECQQIHMAYIVSSHNAQVINRKKWLNSANKKH